MLDGTIKINGLRIALSAIESYGNEGEVFVVTTKAGRKHTKSLEAEALAQTLGFLDSKFNPQPQPTYQVGDFKVYEAVPGAYQLHVKGTPKGWAQATPNLAFAEFLTLTLNAKGA